MAGRNDTGKNVKAGRKVWKFGKPKEGAYGFSVPGYA